MKVLDVIDEGIFGGFARKAVAEEIAKGWVKELRLYKREYGEIPKLDDLVGFAPADKLTVEKAIARDPKVQQDAYNQAVEIIKKEERELAKRGIIAGARKLGTAALWISSFVKWGSRAWMAYNLTSAWKNYNAELKEALNDLEAGTITAKQFNTFHNRILIVFYGEAAAAIGAAVLAMGLPKFAMGLPSGPIGQFFQNLIKTAAALGTTEYVVKWLASKEGASELAYWLTAQGVVDDTGAEIETPSVIGTAIEGLALGPGRIGEHFKAKALEAAKTRKLDDKIPPSLRPKPSPAATPATSAPAANANQADGEDEPPVSGRTQQGAQQVGTSSEWK